jgi:hypothetical protein
MTENENKTPETVKENFFERNRQIFGLALILVILFVALTIISLILPNTKPTLVPVTEIENTSVESME